MMIWDDIWVYLNFHRENAYQAYQQILRVPYFQINPYGRTKEFMPLLSKLLRRPPEDGVGESEWMVAKSCTSWYLYGSVSKPCAPVVHIKIAGKWMFIPLKMVLIGIDPYPYWDS